MKNKKIICKKDSNVKRKAHMEQQSLNLYLKYGHPRETDVVERHPSLEWVFVSCRTVGIVLIPVDTGVVAGGVIAEWSSGGVTFDPLVLESWQA
jgi:hypothetical protein